jgi:hypothetical protein
MFFSNSSNPTYNIDNSMWWSLFDFAHNGGATIIPAHTVTVKNVGAEDAYLTPNPSTGYGITLSPGEIVTTFVPSGDDLYAKSATGSGTSLEVIAAVH